jgi:hypothetical protein
MTGKGATRGDILRRVAGEPIVHFLLLGAAIFALARFMPRDDALPPRDTIVVTQGRIDQLIEIWERTYLRLPTQEELAGLVEDYVRQEVLYREALAMGLDDDDTVVRRRLAQKMEFIAEGIADTAEPTDEQLASLLSEEPDRFRVPGSVSFSQVYLNVDQRGESIDDDAARLLDELHAAGETVDTLGYGDPISLDARYEDLSPDEVDRVFGRGFAARLDAIEAQSWTGPIASGYGIHLVCVHRRTQGWMPSLEEIRDEVRREWMFRQRQQAERAMYETLRQRYTIEIEPPPDIGETASTGEGGGA